MAKKNIERDHKKTSTTDNFLKFVSRQNTDEKKERVENKSTKSDDITVSFNKFFSSLAKALNILNASIDKTLSSKGMLKIVSFVITLILVFILNGGSLDNVLSVPTSGDSINDVPVVVEGLSKDYVITGVPETADVILVGSSLDIYSVKNSSDFEVVVDVSTLSEGEHTVELKAINHPHNLEVVVVQGSIPIKISSKSTQTFPLGYQFVNEDELNQEYSVGLTSIGLETVEVKGAVDTLSKINKVEATIDVANVTKSFEQTADIVATDINGNVLDVEITPNTVEVSCSVASYSKKVPITVLKKGDVSEGKAIKDITLTQSEVTIFGDESSLNEIDTVYVDVNVDGISGTIIINNISLTPIEGVNKMSVNTVNASVEVEESSEKTIENIGIIGVDNDNIENIVYDEMCDVKITGAKSVIDKITEENITAAVDITGLTNGVHTLPVLVTVENKYVIVELLSNKEIEIEIDD